MKDSEKLFEAMSGIDEDLLAGSEEYAQRKSGKKKIIPFIKYASTAAAAACAIFVIGVVMKQTPNMNATKSEDAVNRAPVCEATVAADDEQTANDKSDSYKPGYDSGAASANEEARMDAEAACEEEATWDEGAEEVAQEAATTNYGSDSLSPSDSVLGFAFSGKKSKVAYSFGDVPVDAIYEPVDSDTLKAPTMIPDRYVFEVGLDTNNDADLDIQFELDNEMIAKHVTDATANTWIARSKVQRATAVAANEQNQLIVVYLTVDDKMETTGELEKINDAVLTVEELSEGRIEEIIQEQRNATGEDDPMLTFWVWYKEDTLIYFAGRVSAEECMEIMDSIEPKN